MSFFDTEDVHTVVLAIGADRGGRATPKGLPSSPPMDMCKEMAARLDHRERAGSDPVTFFGAKKDIHILRNSGQRRKNYFTVSSLWREASGQDQEMK